MKQIKLIASDIDGTLIPFGSGDKIPSEIFDLVRQIQSRGIIFFAASGRQYYAAQNLFAPIAHEIGYIAENGCLAYLSDGELVVREEMDQNLADEIIRAIIEKDGCEVQASGEQSYYIQPKTDEFYQEVVTKSEAKLQRVTNIFEHPEPYLKVSACKLSSFTDDEVMYWKEKFGSRCNVQTSGTTWLDMMPLGVNKATALKIVLERLKIDPESVVAFGDNENDREMLELVGIPVAMKNSKAESFTKFVTENVAKTLRNILDENVDW